MVLLLAGLALAALACPSFAAVKTVQDSTWSVWPSTTYYFARLSGPATINGPYTSYTAYITAADSYELYINGTRIDGTYGTNDDNSATTDSMVVTGVSVSDLYVAVKVHNSGLGNGNGLLVDIKARNSSGTDWLGTTTMKRRGYYNTATTTQMSYPAIWYALCADAAAVTGKSDWYSFTSTFLDSVATHVVSSDTKGYSEVICGELKTLDHTPDSHIEVVAGYSGGVESGSISGGGIALRKIDGENLALGKQNLMDPKLTDGKLTNYYKFQFDPTSDSTTFVVDLLDSYLLTKIRIYTGSSSNTPSDWPKNALMGYTAFTSARGLSSTWHEEGSVSNIGVDNADNGGYDYAEVSFGQQYGRYARAFVDESRSSTVYPLTAEFMVFGTGYKYEGSYTSDWVDFGTPLVPKNFETVVWTGTMPAGTGVSVQTQAISAAGDTSEWSGEHAATSFAFDSPEPALKFRYRVNLSTNNVFQTPVLKTLSVSYSDADQPLVSGGVSVSPAKVFMNRDTTFVCTMNYTLATGQNIKTILLSVPNVAFADSVVITDGASVTTLVNGTDFSYISTSDTLRVAFNDSITDAVAGADTLKMYFRTRLLVTDHEFACAVINASGNDGAGPLVIGPVASGAMSVTTNDALDEVLSDVKALPKAFTPNGDGTNDFTVIEFTLASVSNARVKIKIFNSKGVRVATIYDEIAKAADYRISDDNKPGNGASAASLPGYWDGKNDDGDLVAPGMYIYQVVVESDSGNLVKKGVIAVGY